MAKRFAILLLATISGGALGLALAYLGLIGWFVPWRPIGKPLEPATRILALSGSSVWVQTSTGVIYFNASSNECQGECWTVVAEVPSDHTLPVGIDEILPTTCVSPPPFFGAIDQKGDCWRGVWQDYNTVYALRRDGSMWVWSFASGGEWGIVTLVLATCVGAAALFALALAVILFYGLRNRRYSRSQSDVLSLSCFRQPK
ncbi:MAG TPA: hypothetical protein VLA49_03050 [Anaerolineales bacterium]|nr:hypothetical protein [Anaerolineales bacterium]